MRAARPLLVLLVLVGCRQALEPDGGPGEDEAYAAWAATPITSTGRVVDLDGVPVEGAIVTVGEGDARTGADGTWAITGLTRHNALARIEAPGFHVERVPLYLTRPLTDLVADTPAVLLTPRSSTRFLFAGDTALGRRYVDPEGRYDRYHAPEDEEGALVMASDPLPGSEAVFDYVRDLVADPDVFALNFETPVVDAFATPHPTKDYIIYTLPPSVQALVDLGVDYVSLGNNHVYDYLEPGVDSTLLTLDEETPLPHSGLGRDAEEAFVPKVLDVGGTRWSMFAANSIAGRQHAIDYVADATSGGAADLGDDDRMEDTIAAARAAGEVPIAFLHTGTEYAYTPSDVAAAHFDDVAAAGAAFIVASHPHVAQGFGWNDGVLTAWSLGNFAFDQDRIESLLGLVVTADFTDAALTGVRGRGVYIEDYRPRPAAGPLADLLARRVAEHSTAEVLPWGGAALVSFDGAYTEERVERTVPYELDEDGRAVLDLRDLADSGSWLADARVDGAAGAVVGQTGRDSFLYGDLEDPDVDDDVIEDARWTLGGSSKRICVTGAHRGVFGLCSTRAAWNVEDSVWSVSNRVRVPGFAEFTPALDLTLLFWARGQGVGEVEASVEYGAAEGNLVFGRETVRVTDGGTFDWRQVAADLHVPADTEPVEDFEHNPRAVSFAFVHRPPASGEGVFAMDDLALVAWDAPADLVAGWSSDAPNPIGFLRLRGAPETSGTVTVGFVRRVPAALGE